MNASSLAVLIWVSIAAGRVLAATEPLQVLIWNQHNGIAADRGAKTGKVEVFDGQKLVASQENVTFEWGHTSDPKTTITFPGVDRFDRVRVTVTECYGLGGGLSEVQVLRGGQPAAKRWIATASAEYHDDPHYSAQKVVDGVVNSQRASEGYWLLPDAIPGWVELSPASAVPGGPASVGPAGEVSGKFWVTVDDDAVLILNGVQLHHAAGAESSSPEVALKAGDRLVVRLIDVGGGHRFKIIFVSTDRRTIVNFTNRAFKIFKDPETRDFTDAEFARVTKSARQERIAAQWERLPFKNNSEWLWGDTQTNCVLGGIITKEMFKPMPPQ